jgi:hypothetical protein
MFMRSIRSRAVLLWIAVFHSKGVFRDQVITVKWSLIQGLVLDRFAPILESTNSGCTGSLS